MPLSRVAHAFGETRLIELSTRLGLTPDQCLAVLDNIELFRDFFSWVEADTFILERIYSYENAQD